MAEGNPRDEEVRRAAQALAERVGEPPELFLALGSGMAAVADAIVDAVDIPTSEVAGLPRPTVCGHVGLLRVGWLCGVRVLAQLGRVHLYEGRSPDEVTRTVEAAAELGCATFVVTNAAGGLDPTLEPGHLVAIRDQLNLTGASPLIGVFRDERPFFVDMSRAYDPELRELAFEVADHRGVDLRSGVYVGVVGPAYETPAEVDMLRALGGDVVGMSTVLEVIAARARGLRVLGLSLVTNVPGLAPTSHDEVLATCRKAGPRLGELLVGVVERLGRSSSEGVATDPGRSSSEAVATDPDRSRDEGRAIEALWAGGGRGAASSSPFSARWADAAVEVIDQTLLPDRCETLRCADTETLAEAIARLQIRGAPAIGVAAAYGIAAAAHRAAKAGAKKGGVIAAALDATERLRPVRPTAVNLAWACDRMTATAGTADGDGLEAARRLLAEARAIEAEDRAACVAMGSHGADYLARVAPRPEGLLVLTHCNTGALCTAGIGTAFGVVRTLFERSQLALLWVNETRPLLQGARLTAWEALELGMPHAVVVDAAAGSLFSAGQVDAVVVGADRIVASGDVANKIGTYPLAVLCARHEVPFVVVAPTSSVDLTTAEGSGISVEQRAPDEVAFARGRTRLAPAHSPAHNPAFDVTAAALVSALVTERGVVEQPDRERLAAHLGAHRV